MPKQKTPKTQLQERAALRAGEQRRLDHAYAVYGELIQKHLEGGMGERDVADLWNLHCRLTQAIKNQHIKDAEIKQQHIINGYTNECLNKGDF